MTDMIDPGSAEPGIPSRAFTESARITGDVQRATIGGVNPSGAFDNVRTSTNDLTPRDSSAGILSTARSTAGRVLTGADIKPTTRVLVGGVETTVAAACAMGALARNGDGTYSEVGASQASTGEAQGDTEPSPDAQQQQDHQPAKVADLPTEAHQLAQDFVSRVDNIAMMSAINSLAETGDVSTETIASIAGQMQLEPHEVQNRIATVRGAYEAQAREMIGDGADEIIAYGYQHQPAEMRKAIKAHVENEDATAYNGIVKSYWLTLDQRDPSAILTARNADQLQPKRERNGTITVNIPGVGRMAWGGAVRAGFIGQRK